MYHKNCNVLIGNGIEEQVGKTFFRKHLNFWRNILIYKYCHPMTVSMHHTHCLVNVMYDDAFEYSRTLEIDPADIKAVGITNQRETTVVWDKRTGEPLANAVGELKMLGVHMHMFVYACLYSYVLFFTLDTRKS